MLPPAAWHGKKGFDRLIALFADLPSDSHLTIHGEGPELDLLTEQIDDLELHDQVTLAGFTENLAAALAGADACLISSHWEGLPNVALEALAVGTRVIATPESGGIAELANAAVSEAVVIAAWGDPFAKAMLQVRSHMKSKSAPSLLPAKYVAEDVSATLNAKLCQLLALPATKDVDIASRAGTLF